MTEGLNRATMIGNLGQDPELRYTQNGTAVLNARLAVTERRKVRGEWQDVTTWFGVIVWGKRGEALNNILAKGDRIAVDGRVDIREWETITGEKRTTVSIDASHVVLCGSPKGGGNRQSKPQKPQPAQAPLDDGFDDDDIPF